jgi:hypothetical protein
MDRLIRREKYNERRTYPVIRCDCGAEVHCDSSWANSCERCDREYNGSGQLLASRSHWGEETGESF